MNPNSRSAEIEVKFWEAAKDGNVEEVKEILRNNPTIDVNWKGVAGFTALTQACWRGHDSIVSLLLAHPDIDVNQKTKDGSTPFVKACCYGRTSCVRLLLKDHRVLVNEQSVGSTPLSMAASNGHLDITKLMIASGKELNLGAPGMKSDAIGRAWTKGETDVATLLERFKENPEKTRSEVRKELKITGRYPSSSSFSFPLTEFICSSIRFPCDYPTKAHQGAIHRLPCRKAL